MLLFTVDDKTVLLIKQQPMAHNLLFTGVMLYLICRITDSYYLTSGNKFYAEPACGFELITSKLGGLVFEKYHRDMGGIKAKQ